MASTQVISPSNTAPPPADGGGSSIDMGLVVGIPVAVVIFLLLIGLAVFLVWRWKYRRKYSMNETFTPKKNLTKSMHNEEGLTTPANGRSARNGSISRPEILVRTPSHQAELYVVRHLFEAKEPNHLTIATGRIVEVMQKNPNGWWRGMIDDKVGWFPASYVRKIEASEKINYEKSSPDKKTASPGRLVNKTQSSSHKKKAPDIPTVHKTGENRTNINKKQDVSIRSDKEQLICGDESALDNGDISIKVEDERSVSIKKIDQVQNEEQLEGFINEIFTVEDEISVRDESDENENKAVELTEERIQSKEAELVERGVTNRNDEKITNKSVLSTESYEMKESFGPESSQEILDDTYDGIRLTAYSDSPASKGAVVEVTSSGIWKTIESKPIVAGKSLKNESQVDKSADSLDKTIDKKELFHNSLNGDLDIKTENKFVSSPGTSPILAYPGDKRHSTPKRKGGVEHTYVAMFPFKAVHREQLSLAPNDVVVSKGDVVNGWLKGSNKATKQEGWFPRSYVREAHENQKKLDKSVNISESSDTDFRDHSFDDDVTGMAYSVVHPYTATQDGDLALSEGQVVVVFEMLENGWWRGVIDGKEGWFPGAYVEAVPQTPVTPKFGGNPFSTLPKNFKQGDKNSTLTVNSGSISKENKVSTLPPGVMGSSPSLTEMDESNTVEMCDKESVPKPDVPKRFVIPKLMKIKSKSSKKSKEKPVRPVPPAPTISHPIAPPRRGSQQKIKRPSVSRPNEPPPRPPSDLDESNSSKSSGSSECSPNTKDASKTEFNFTSEQNDHSASPVQSGVKKVEPFPSLSSTSEIAASHMDGTNNYVKLIDPNSEEYFVSSPKIENNSSISGDVQLTDKSGVYITADKTTGKSGVDITADKTKDESTINKYYMTDHDSQEQQDCLNMNVTSSPEKEIKNDVNIKCSEQYLTNLVSTEENVQKKHRGLTLNTQNVKFIEKSSPDSNVYFEDENNTGSIDVSGDKISDNMPHRLPDRQTNQSDKNIFVESSNGKPVAPRKPPTPVNRKLDYKQDKLEELILKEIIQSHHLHIDDSPLLKDSSLSSLVSEEKYDSKDFQHKEMQFSGKAAHISNKDFTGVSSINSALDSKVNEVKSTDSAVLPYGEADVEHISKTNPVLDDKVQKVSETKQDDSLLSEIMNSFEDLRNTMELSNTGTYLSKDDASENKNPEESPIATYPKPQAEELSERSIMQDKIETNQRLSPLIETSKQSRKTELESITNTDIHSPKRSDTSLGKENKISKETFLSFNLMDSPRDVRTPIVSSPKNEDYNTISVLSNKSALSSIEPDSELSFKSQLDSINMAEEDISYLHNDILNVDVEEALPPLPEVPPPESPPASPISTNTTPNVSVGSGNDSSMLTQEPVGDLTPDGSTESIDVATPDGSINRKPPYELMMTSPYVVIRTPHSKQDVTMPTEEVSVLTKSVGPRDDTTADDDLGMKSIETNGGSIRNQLSSLFDKLLPDVFRGDDHDIEEGKLNIEEESSSHPVGKINFVSSPYMRNELKTGLNSSNPQENDESSVSVNNSRNTDRSALSANTAFTIESGYASPDKSQVSSYNQPAKPPRRSKSLSSDEERSGTSDEKKDDKSIYEKWKLPPLRPAPSSSYNMQKEIKQRSPPILTNTSPTLTNSLGLRNDFKKLDPVSTDVNTTESISLLQENTPKVTTPPPPLQKVSSNDSHDYHISDVSVTQDENKPVITPVITPPSALVQPRKLSTPESFKFFTPTKFVAKEYKHSTPSPQSMIRDVSSTYSSSLDNEVHFEVKQNSNLYNVKVVNSVKNNTYENDTNGIHMNDHDAFSSDARIIRFDTPKPFHKPGVIRKVVAPKSLKDQRIEEGISEF